MNEKKWNETWFAKIGVDEEHAEKLKKFLQTVIFPASLMELKTDAYQFIKKKIEEYGLTYSDLAVIIVMLYNSIFDAAEKMIIERLKKEVCDERTNKRNGN